MVKIDGPLPPETKRHGEIVRVKWTEPRQVIVLSDAIFSVFTHWHGNRSDQCYGQIETCEYCQRAIPLRWRGYLHVIAPPSPEAFFLEFSESVAQAISIAFTDRDSLRGSMFKIYKSKGGLRGRFHVEPVERCVAPDTLAKSCTPEGVLKFLWNVKRS